jgi:hypothetical protein
MIDPALLGAGADVEVHALDRFQRAGRVLAAFQDVMDAGQYNFLAAEIDRRGVVVARALLPALAFATGLAPALVLVGLAAAARRLAPFGHHFALEYRPLRDIDQGIDGPRIVDLVVRNRRSVGDAGTGVREHLVLEAAHWQARAEQFGHARVLVADQPLEILPLGMRRVGRRVERVECDMAGTAGSADQEGRLDRAIGQLADPLIGGDAGLVDQRAVKARPASRLAIQGLPLGGVEARVGKLANPQGTGGGAELEIAGRVPLVELAALAVRVVRVERRILEAAGRVDVARLADVLQEHVVAGHQSKP